MLSSALALASHGMAIFPCRVRDKRPATANGCNDATRNPDRIRDWWKTDPDFNVAIATGTPSGVFVVDVDADDGDDGEIHLCKLGVLPATVEVITARGRHLYFRMPKAPIGNSASKIAPHVDVRGTGGYVLAPPSMHPSGKRYEWSVDTASAFADAPDWLLDKLCGKQQRARDPGELISNAAEGQRNDRIARLAGHLLRHRVSAELTLSLLSAWNAKHCKPPLDDTEVVQVIDSKCAFTKTAVKRAFEGAKEAGVDVQITVDLEHKTMTLTPVKVSAVNTGTDNDLDKWIREHDACPTEGH